MTWYADGIRISKKRAHILLAMMMCFSVLLFFRMFFLQVIEAEKYKTLADKNRIGSHFLSAPRGIIYDRNGVPLAGNRKTFRAIITAEDTGFQVAKTLDLFQRLVPLREDEVNRILKETANKKSFVPVRVKDDLTREQVSAVELNLPSLSGISIEESLMRVYPKKEKTAHTIGYVKAVDDPKRMLREEKMGKTGVEQFYNDDLTGKTGVKKMEVNSVGRQVRELERQEPVQGEDLQLSIDARLQDIGFAALKEETGSAVLMDVETGEVLMLVSTPSFDPNLFNYPISTSVWKSLNDELHRPQVNKAISEHYAPGSTFKIVVALAGLEAGVIEPDTQIHCDGKMYVGNHPFHCWKKTGHGSLNLKQALQHSCDVYFYEVARRVGADKIADMAERLGFGSVSGIELNGELSGLVPTNMWKVARRNESWRLGDTMNMGIGQGFLETTPIQMVQMMARVANGKKKVKPTLIKVDKDRTEQFDDLDIDPRYIAAVKEGLEDVVNKRGGTAFGARIDVDGQKMGGKTASTQIRQISLAEREQGIKQQHELAWKDRDHAFFLAYAPVDNPRYALVVAVEHGGGGGMVAAPIAGTIMKQVLELEIADEQNRQEKMSTLIPPVKPEMMEKEK